MSLDLVALVPSLPKLVAVVVLQLLSATTLARSVTLELDDDSARTVAEEEPVAESALDVIALEVEPLRRTHFRSEVLLD